MGPPKKFGNGVCRSNAISKTSSQKVEGELVINDT